MPYDARTDDNNGRTDYDDINGADNNIGTNDTNNDNYNTRASRSLWQIDVSDAGW